MKTFLIALNSLFVLLPVNIINGCSYSKMPEEYRFFLLQPDIDNIKGLSLFFYTAENFYYSAKEDMNKPMIETNAKEWQTHTHYKGSWKEIAFVIYNINTETFLNHLDSLISKNSFVSHLNTHYKKEFEYLTYARRCELMVNNKDPWRFKDDYANSSDTALVSTCLQEGQALLKKANTPFLKLRIAYQLLKLNYYHPEFGVSAQTIYDEIIEPIPINSWIKESAHFYTITALDGTPMKGENEYQYLLSTCFDRSIDKRFRCVQLFDRKNIRHFLPLTKNNHEKAVMWLMHELQNPMRSLFNIEKIYALDPSNKDLPILLSREINKIEDWLLTPSLTEQPVSIAKYDRAWSLEQQSITKKNNLSDKKYRNEVYKFVIKVIAEKKQNNLGLWHVLASYLCILNQDMPKAQLHLADADQFKQTDKIAFQVKLNKLILNFTDTTKLTTELEKQILNFSDYNSKHPDVFLNQDVMINQLYLYIGKHLLHSGDVAEGIFFLSKTSRVLGTISNGIDVYKSYFQELLEHAKAKDYDNMIAILDKKNKSPFEAFLTTRDVKTTWYYDDDTYLRIDTAKINKYKVLDYKSMYYVQNDLLDSALLCVNQIPSGYWNNWPYNLFRCFPFKVPGGMDYQSNNDFYPYNKRMYLQRMCDLKALIKNNIGDVARHYFVLATGYFNMSYHGNYWIMNRPYKLGDELYSVYYNFDMTNKPFNTNYYGCALAQENYLKAMDLAKDTAFSALCAARASVCNIHLQEINWRTTTTFNEKKDSWQKEFKPQYGIFKQSFESKFNIKDYFEDFVSNCYYYEHLNNKYY